MTSFDEIIGKLWKDKNPYSGFPANLMQRDIQGWNSHHPYLAEAIAQTKTRVVVEIGVWKGGSSIHMGKFMRDNDHDGVVISVDTFLGSWEHWEQPQFWADLSFSFGYPHLYYKFITNVINEGVSNFVIPLPLDSGNALHVLSRLSIRPGVIHIDGGHDYEAALADLRRWWPLLADGGQLIMDDYDAEGVVWPSVRDAVKQFITETPHLTLEAQPYKARLIKQVGRVL